jgi:aromatic-L-amino-acid decarboxylase
MTLGLGLENVRRVPSDDRFRLRPGALAEAIARDREAGRKPLAVVATLGTTSTTSIDPVGEIADICAREGIWLHVDAAYAGSAAICPELRDGFEGWERADSIVLNPHKWLFTPIDCSVLLVRDQAHLRETFSLVPDYLTTSEDEVTNLMDLGFQLGRRFRALKLWMVIRALGVEGLRERIRDHCRLAADLASWIEADPRFELAAPVPFSTVSFRYRAGDSLERLNRLNERLLADVNAQGPVFLSHTVLRDRYTLRAAIGNLQTTDRHVEQAWEIIRAAAVRLAS